MRPPLRITSTGRPILYELDARAWLDRLSRTSRRRIHLGDVLDEALEPYEGSSLGDHPPLDAVLRHARALGP